MSEGIGKALKVIEELAEKRLEDMVIEALDGDYCKGDQGALRRCVRDAVEAKVREVLKAKEDQWGAIVTEAIEKQISKVAGSGVKVGISLQMSQW
jgi:hypothetical protein